MSISELGLTVGGFTYIMSSEHDMKYISIYLQTLKISEPFSSISDYLFEMIVEKQFSPNYHNRNN